MGWDGNARGTINSDYTKNIYSTGTEAAYNMYLQYRVHERRDLPARHGVSVHAGRREVLREAKLSFKEPAGKYYMASSNSHETYWDVRNAITDLAAVRSLFPLAIQVSQQLGLDADLRGAVAERRSNNLTPYPSHDTAPTCRTSRRSRRPATTRTSPPSSIWPYDQHRHRRSPTTQTAVNTWNARPFPYGNVWSNDAVQAARLGLGDQAYQGMKTMLQRYQNYPNGMTTNTNGVFEYLGVHLVGDERVADAELQRQDPGVPGGARRLDASSASSPSLAKDGFLVSSEREAGEIKYVGLKSLYGKQATVVNPWGTQQIRVRRTSDNAILTTVSAGEVTFATAANTVYVVERTAKPLSGYASTTLTGSANQGVKSLSGTVSTLGLPVAPAAGHSLRAKANSQYVSAATRGSPLIANGTSIGTAQQFDRVNQSGGTIALRARVNNKFVAAEAAGAQPLIANRAQCRYLGDLPAHHQPGRLGEPQGPGQQQARVRQGRRGRAADRRPRRGRSLGEFRPGK